MSKRKNILLYPYDEQNFNPPAPSLGVYLSIPSSTSQRQSVKSIALLDSGADITAIPRWAIQQLQLKYVDETFVSGYDRAEKKAFVYSVKVIFEKIGNFTIRAIATDDIYVLVGRDILNKLQLFLKGRTRVFEVS